MASDRQISFHVNGERVVGLLRLAAGDPAPVVVLLHGFAGQKHEMAIPSEKIGIFDHVAAKLALSGLSSLRIDFRGAGDSDGRFEDTTYSRQIDDALAAMDFLAAEPAVDGRRVLLIGWSQGGLVAAAVAGRSNRPSAVALWAAVGEPAVSFPNLVGRETYMHGLLSDGAPVDVALPWGAQVRLRRGFFAEVARFDPFAEIATYGGPLFVAEGSNDTAIAPGTAEKFAAAHPGPHDVWVAAMDHAFNVGDGVAMLDRLIAATVAFFAKHGTPARPLSGDVV